MLKQFKLLVCIAFHNNPDRIQYIKNVIENYKNYQLDVDIIVDTNEMVDLDANVCVHTLEHPYHLTWLHRKHFLDNIDNYDYFMYVEDDMLVPYQCFSEYIENFNMVWGLGYVPSFIRIETLNDKEFVTDVIVQQNIEPYIIQNKKFIRLTHPYHAFWIMPQKELKETLVSNFVRKETSRENAASYSILELNKIPIVRIEENEISKMCYSYHLANNYVCNPNTPFAKIEVKNILKQN